MIDAPRGGRDQIGGRKRGPVSLTSSGCKEVILQPAKLSKITMKPVRSNTTRIDRMDISLSLSAAMRGSREEKYDRFCWSAPLSLHLSRCGGRADAFMSVAAERGKKVCPEGGRGGKRGKAELQSCGAHRSRLT